MMCHRKRQEQFKQNQKSQWLVNLLCWGLIGVGSAVVVFIFWIVTCVFFSLG